VYLNPGPNYTDLYNHAELSCSKRYSPFYMNPADYTFQDGNLPGTPRFDVLYLNNPTDLTVPRRRFGMQPRPPLALPQAGIWDVGLPMWPPWTLPGTPPLAATMTYPALGDSQAAPTSAWWPQDNPNLIGADILLTDLISMDVRVLTAQTGPAAGFVDLFDSRFDTPTSYRNNYDPTSGASIFYKPVINPSGPAVFDTWSRVRDDQDDFSGWSTGPSLQSVPLAVNIRALQITLRVWDRRTEQTRQITIIQDL
jgi:hypothetical protein